MPWKWRDWISCHGKWPFTSRVTPSSINTLTSQLTSASVGDGSRKKRSKSRSRPSCTNLPQLIMQQISVTLKELECPLCQNTCVPPIYPCINGHLLCSSCRHTTSKCPICSETFSATRNIFAEQFVHKYAQPCRYANDGCIFLRWKGCDMKPHEVSCFYRPIQCIVPSCMAPDKDAISYRRLMDHLMDSHKVHGTNRLPVVVNFQTDTLTVDRRWLPYYVKAHGCDFYLMLEARRPHFWAWVWVQPPKLPHSHNSNAPALPSNSASPGSSRSGYGENFVFVSTLVFQNPEKYAYVKWSGAVHSIRTPASLIIQEGLCFGGSETFMQHFETPDQIFTLTLNIEKKLLPRTGSNTSSAGGSSVNSSSRRTRSKSKASGKSVVSQNLYPPLNQNQSSGQGEASGDPNSNDLPPPAALPKLGVQFAGIDDQDSNLGSGSAETEPELGLQDQSSMSVVGVTPSS